MAEDVVIRAERLGKKYVIGHEAERERYVALRDVIARGARNAWRMAADMAKGRVVIPGDTVEEVWALKDVNFEVRRGEVLGIIGRNGAGKSTLLKILSRITEPTEGRVTIKGRVASLLEVGTGFHPELSGRENIYLNGAILGMTRAEIKRKFDEIVAFAEVEKFLDTPVKRYSSGMYVRLAFAVAAHLEPEILVVDEVLAVGDMKFQAKCLGKMHDVSAGEGRTVLFVSHNMTAVLQLAPRSLLLRDGQVAFDGPTENATAFYANANGDPSVTVFDVETVPRKGFGTGAARIVSLWFNRSTPRFEADEDFEFALKVRAVEDVRDLLVSMTLFSSNGMPIGSSFSPESIMLQQSEVCDVNVRLPSPRMAPGHYHCSVGIGKGDHVSGHTVLDGAFNVLHFEVMPEMGGAGTLSNWSHDWGRLRFPALDVSTISLLEEIQKPG